MSTAPESLKPNRTPWIIAGVLGCLVICLLVAILAGGAYIFVGQSKPTQVVQSAPTVAAQTLPTVTPVLVPTIAAVPTAPLVAQPTQTSAQPTTLPPAQQTAVSSQPALTPVTQTAVSSQPVLTPVTQTPLAPAASSTPTKAAAPSGKIAFSKCDGNCDTDGQKTVWVMNADGTNAKKILDRASEPTWSPDGTKIAYYHWTDGIFVANADGSNPLKVVGDTLVGYLDWSHDGRLIAFAARPGGQGNIAVNVVPPDGSALKDSNARRYISVGNSPAWSPDDTMFAIDSCDTANHCGIFKVTSGGGGAIIAVVTDGGGAPVWSPDGKKIVYQADIDGQKQLVIIGPDGSGKTQLTQGPSMHVDAGWSSDGNFIFYRSPESGTWAIWRMNSDGSNRVKLIDNVGPVDFAHERLAVSR